MAPEEPIAPSAAIPAATNNNEQNNRRSDDGLNLVPECAITAQITFR